MKTYAYISRHALTGEQLEIINAANITVITLGDMDGFAITKDAVDDAAGLEVDGVIVVHAGAVARLMQEGCEVGVFNNLNRAPVGEKPDFGTDSLYIWNYSVNGIEDDVKVTFDGVFLGGSY